jgi:hemerythrin
MPLIWDDKFATGVRQIDLQHLELIQLINELESAHAAGRQAEAIDEVLPRLGAYVLFHFGTEESLIPVQASAHAEKHRRQHAEFADRVAELREGILDSDDLEALIIFLRRWLVEHIMKTDRELSHLILGQVPTGT